MKPDDLVRALGNPRPGEFACDTFTRTHGTRGWAGLDRLEALAELKHLADAGRVPAPARRRGTNTHVHTNESFSIFRSASEAAWRGFQEGLDVLGINDHYTIGGHEEFAKACAILGLRATFSMEAVALSERLQREGVRCNDPGNAGRTYLSAKGVMHDLPHGSQGRRDLETMRRALRSRNEEMVRKLNVMLTRTGHGPQRLRLSFDDVLALTPRGNTTERHVCQAVAELIDRSLPDKAARLAFLKQLAGGFDAGEIETSAGYQNMLRAKLVKAGKEAYVEESPEAFLTWERMRAMYLEFGAIPSYPVLGNPVVEFEEDLDRMFGEIEGAGFHAIEVIPHRNTRERLAAILEGAARRHVPVFNGTEHNTKTPMPLLDKWSGSDEFIEQFELGADVLIGHQVLSRYAGLGYVDASGAPAVRDRERGLRLFAFAGRLIQKPQTLALLQELGSRKVRSLLAALSETAPAPHAWSIRSAAMAGPLERILAGIDVKDGAASVATGAAAESLRQWADENVI